MPIEFQCNCGQRLSIAEKYAGATAKCPACGSAVVIPAATPAPAPTPVQGPPLPSSAGTAPSGAGVAPATDAGASSGRLCAICQSPISAADATTACPSCGAKYHADCWQENQGCAVYGCEQVPATEGRETLEIPVSFWGQEEKPCPSCGQTILAAAVRCRHCGATFSSARPESSHEFRSREGRQRKLPAVRRTVIWMFVCSLLPCTALLAAIFGAVWYPAHRAEIRSLPAIFNGLCIMGIGIAVVQTVVTLVMILMYSVFRT